MAGTLADASGPLSPLAILIVVVVLQFVEGFVDNPKKKGKKSDELTQLRQEIKDLLKEASSLSTPSTFAQAAKLRRLAAAKEKELIKGQEECDMEQKSSYHLYTRALLGLKVLLYAGLCLWFWGTPVAKIPQHLLQPFGKFLSWRGGDSAAGQVTVGTWDNTMACSNFQSQQVHLSETAEEVV